MKRIVLIVTVFPQVSETFIVNKFIGLLDKGWDVHIVYQTINKKGWRNFEACDLRKKSQGRIHCAWPTTPKWLAFLFYPLALASTFLLNPGGTLRYLIRGYRYLKAGVVRAFYLDASIIALNPNGIHFEFADLAVGRAHIKKLLGCAVVVSGRGADICYVGIEDPFYYKEVWETADIVHFVAMSLRRQAMARGCPESKPYQIIPSGVDTNFFSGCRRDDQNESNAAQRPFRILSVGRLMWKKGYEYALEAVRILLDSGVNYVYRIVGDGNHKKNILFYLQELGLQERVEFLGAQPPEEVRRQLCWADVFLQASVSEGLSNTVLEAQAMGLPVVCSDAGGLPECVVDGVTGFVVPRRNSNALTEKLRMLQQNPWMRKAMGQAGIQRVCAEFSLPKQIERFDRLYKTLVYPEEKR